MQITQEICRKAEVIPADFGVCIPASGEYLDRSVFWQKCLSIFSGLIHFSFPHICKTGHTWVAYEQTIQPLKNALGLILMDESSTYYYIFFFRILFTSAVWMGKKSRKYKWLFYIRCTFCWVGSLTKGVRRRVYGMTLVWLLM